MGTNHKTEEQMTEALLRNYVKQQRPPESLCREFDPDTVNAYLERVLTEPETGRYEFHLAACAFCRQGILTLAQLAEVEAPLALTATAQTPAASAVAATSQTVKPAQEEASLMERLKGWFGGFATPRFALAAVAAIVLAVTIPVVLVSNRQANKSTEIAKQQQAELSPPLAQEPPVANASPDNESVARTAETPATAANPQSARPAAESQRQQQPGTTAASGEGQTALAAAPVTQPIEPKQDQDSKPAAVADAQARPAEEDRARRENNAAAKRQDEVAGTVAPAAPAPAAKKELEKIDSADTMRIQEAGKDKAREKVVKPASPVNGRSTGSSTAAIRAESNTAPASGPPPTREPMPNKGVRAYRDSREKITERPNVTLTRKIKDKHFWLLEGVWTDRDYRKEKDLPVVPLIKDSDNYKEVLAKISGLQKYFSAFGSNDKAIVVYKNTVYRLLPQSDK